MPQPREASTTYIVARTPQPTKARTADASKSKPVREAASIIIIIDDEDDASASPWLSGRVLMGVVGALPQPHPMHLKARRESPACAATTACRGAHARSGPCLGHHQAVRPSLAVSTPSCQATRGLF
jgi:hypothetical protein